MKITLSVIKADIGSIGGHITPSQALLNEVKSFVKENGKNLIIDVFDHPYWDYVRDQVSEKANAIRRQGFSGAAMLPYSELEYGGIVEKLEKLEKKFKLRD